MNFPRRRVALVLILVAALLSTTPYVATAAETQPLTHETLYLMKRVGSPVVSPDGRWVVFPVTEPSYDDKEQVADLWLAPTDGATPPRRITGMKGSEASPAWSTDSRRIAFTTRRDGDEVSQVYVLDLAGGEAQRVTRLSTGASAPKFSPDGRSILFVSNVYRGALDEEANKAAAREEKERKFKLRAYDSFPIRNWDRWLDGREPHLFVQSLEEGSVARDLLAGTELAAASGFAGTPGSGGTETLNGTWTPDGASIVFAATTSRNTSAFAEVDYALYRVAAGGGDPQAIASRQGSYGNPRFSPDGKTLFVTFEPNTASTYNLTQLVAFDWPSVQNERVVAKTDRSVDDYVISADGRTVYFTAEDSGLIKIYSVPARGGEARLAVEPTHGVYTALNGAAKAPVLVALWGSSVNPAEVVRIDVNSASHRNLSSFNVELARSIDWSVPEHFWFTSSRGRRIHNLLVKPENFDPSKKYPLFVLIHGGPHNMWRDQITLRWNYHLLAKPGYVMLLTNYTGSTGFGAAFAQAIQGDPLRGPAQELIEAADAAIGKYSFIDAERQVAGGASYGGHLASALQAWSGTRFKALINHAGLINLESQWATSDYIYHREIQALGPVWEQNEVWRTQNPIRFAADFKTPMLISAGERDYRVPLNNALEMWSVMQRLQIPSRLLIWEENHWILNPENSRVFYREVDEWLRRWVVPGPVERN